MSLATPLPHSSLCRAYLLNQKIEQFIESIFPTPTDPVAIERQRQLAATGETPEEAAVAKKEMLLLIAAVVGTLTVISAFMVRLQQSHPSKYSWRQVLIVYRFSSHGLPAPDLTWPSRT